MKPAPTTGRVKLEQRAIAALTDAAYNPRKMTEAKRAALAASLGRFGLVQPVVVNRRTVDKGWDAGGKETVVGGHQRLAVLRAQGATSTDVVLVDLTPDEEKALNVTLNSPTVAGEFTAGLGGLLEEMKTALPELSSALGFPGLVADAAELSAKAGGDVAGLADPSADPRPPARTRLGDVYELDAHRVICGDSTDPAVLARLVAGAAIDVVYTDPPYGVAYDAGSKLGGIDHGLIVGDALERDALAKLVARALANAVAVARDVAAFYVWHAMSGRDDCSHALKVAGLVERQYLVWVKPRLVLGHADYQWAHEPCFYAAKAGCSPAWYGGRDQTTVWRLAQRRDSELAVVLGPGVVITDGAGAEVALGAPKPKTKLRVLRVAAGETIRVRGNPTNATVWEFARDAWSPEHPTQKPVALAARALLNSTKEGDRALDLFAGAGSLLLACEQLRRVAYLAELEPRYVDVIVSRWEKMTGRKAILHRSDPSAAAGGTKRRAVRRGKA